jgi:hypothetical protein
MPSAAYLRRQADICLRLSVIASDDAVSRRLVQMAKEYSAAAEGLEKPQRIDAPEAVAGAAMSEEIPPFNPSTDGGASPAEP